MSLIEFIEEFFLIITVSEPSSINQNNFRPIFVPLKTILNDKDLKSIKSQQVQTPSVVQNSKSQTKTSAFIKKWCYHQSMKLETKIQRQIGKSVTNSKAFATNQLIKLFALLTGTRDKAARPLL